MPTVRRKESRTGFYHIVVKGINHEKIFNQHREKVYLEDIVLKYSSKYHPEIYSFCIMSNHAHFIIRAEIQNLSVFMARVLAEYASYYNYKHHRNGHVFQNRFSSECIETEVYLWNCVRYIHLNPVKAGMVKAAVSYKYSSMHEFSRQSIKIIHENALALFSNKFDDFEGFDEFHNYHNYDVFEDVKEDICRNREELATRLAKQLYKRYGLVTLNQVFEEKNMREEYLKQLRDKLHISKKRAEELFTKVRSEMESK